MCVCVTSRGFLIYVHLRQIFDMHLLSAPKWANRPPESASAHRESKKKTTKEHSQWSVVRWNVSAYIVIYNSIETVQIDSSQLIHDSSTLLYLNWLCLSEKLLYSIDFFIDFVKLARRKRQRERKNESIWKMQIWKIHSFRHGHSIRQFR